MKTTIKYDKNDETNERSIYRRTYGRTNGHVGRHDGRRFRAKDTKFLTRQTDRPNPTTQTVGRLADGLTTRLTLLLMEGGQPGVCRG